MDFGSVACVEEKVDFGFRILDFGFRILDWILDFGLIMDFGFCSKTAVFWTKLWIVDTEFPLNQLNLSNLKIGRCTDRSAITVASVMFYGFRQNCLAGYVFA